MAHVFKPVYTKPIPAGAEPVKYKGAAAVRWRGRGGKWVTALLCEDKPDRCRVEGATWYVEYRDHAGQVQRKKGYTDKGATESLMAELVRQAARISSGLLPVEAARPRLALTELIEKYRNYIVDNGSSEAYAGRVFQQVTDVVAGVGAVRPSDLTPTAVQAWLGELRTANNHKGHPFGKSTSGHYLCAVKAFTRWLAVVEKSEPVDHLSAVRRKTDDTDIRKQRRPLAPKELDRLLGCTHRSKAVRYGLTGPERSALYLTASTTGLRARELSSLTPDSIDLAAATVVIQGGKAKNKKTYKLPLAADTVKALRGLLKRHAGGPIWPHRKTKSPTTMWWRHGAMMIADDLAEAGIAKSVNGKSYDFHALRGQFATDLDRAGVHLIRAQRLMRLSSPSLLSKHYAKPDEAEIAADVNKLRRRKR